MVKKVEEILGLGAFTGTRTVPGTLSVNGREHWYIEDDGSGDFDALFSKVVTAAAPPFYKSGGALTGGCELTLPDGRKFHALSYKGDLEGWRKQILYGAERLNVAAACAVNGILVFAEDQAVPIRDCYCRFY